eukprot:2277459-Rhodomonas_salina.1
MGPAALVPPRVTPSAGAQRQCDAHAGLRAKTAQATCCCRATRRDTLRLTCRTRHTQSLCNTLLHTANHPRTRRKTQARATTLDAHMHVRNTHHAQHG